MMQESKFYLIFLVSARHLDYSCSYKLCRTLAKHPSDGSKNGDVGHAWIYLHGIKEGKELIIEGGHSGELGIVQPRYFDGIMNYADYGYADPTAEEKKKPIDEANPIKYLWETQRDGFFQKGSGGHLPTCAAKVDLTEEQFCKIVAFIDPGNYCYSHYSLIGNQCSSFLCQIADLIDFPLECYVIMPLEKKLTFAGRTISLWQDDRYSSITLASPDRLEQSLQLAIAEGRAENALAWYRRRHGKSFFQSLEEMGHSLTLWPSRFIRFVVSR